MIMIDDDIRWFYIYNDDSDDDVIVVMVVIDKYKYVLIDISMYVFIISFYRLIDYSI